jgi:predicted transcriptional regulator
MKKLRVSDDLALPIDAVTQRISILGRTGSGKSYSAGVLVEEVLKAHQQVAILDPKGDWWGLRASADGKTEGLPITIMGGEHGDVPLEPTAGALVADVIVSEGISVVIDMSLFESKAAEVRFAEAFLDRLYRKNRKPILLVIDEADIFAPQRPERNETTMLNRMETICRRGRSKGVGVVLVSQRSASIHKGCLSQTELMIAHQTTAPQDKKALEGWVVAHGDDEQHAAFMKAIPKLEKGVAIAWSPSWLNLFKQTKVRLKETYDSSRTPTVGMRRRAPKVLAKVDLELLKKHMAETIKKVQSEDPKALNAEIARLLRYSKGLESERASLVRKLTDEKPQPMLPTRTMRQPAPKVVKKPFIMKRDLDRLEKLEAELLIIKSKERGVVDNIEGLLRKLTDTVHAAFKAGEAVFVPSVQTFTKTVPMKVTTATTARPGSPAPVIMMPRPPASRHDGPAIPLKIVPQGLGGGERRILQAMAQFHPNEVTRSRIAVLCGIKANGTTLATYLSRLKVQGMISPGAGDVYTLTESGVKFIGDVPRMTSAEVQASWLGKFHAGPRGILKAAIDAYPNPVSMKALSEQLGISSEGTTLSTYVSRLRAAGVIVTIGGSKVEKSVMASAELFEGA